MITNRKLDHIGLAVTDAAAAAKWYMQVLGFRMKGQFPTPSGDTVYFVENADGSVVYEIYKDDALTEQTIGKIDHISYPSSDIEADYAFCVDKGYKICTDGIEGIATFWEKGIRYFKILSATGEQVEFCQRL